MTGSLDLLKKALEVKSAAAWARDLNVTRATLTMAKTRGRLSPVLAGNFAIELGEPAEKWVAIAAIEQEENTPLLNRLRDSQPQWRKL
nr:hypothetical protein [uncultured Rhodoferax sp.]